MTRRDSPLACSSRTNSRARPLPHRPEQGEVVVLKQEDPRPFALEEVPHLAHDAGGLARADDLCRVRFCRTCVSSRRSTCARSPAGERRACQGAERPCQDDGTRDRGGLYAAERSIQAEVMFVIELTYKAELAEIDARMAAHVAFLKKSLLVRPLPGVRPEDSRGGRDHPGSGQEPAGARSHRRGGPLLHTRAGGVPHHRVPRQPACGRHPATDCRSGSSGTSGPGRPLTARPRIHTRDLTAVLQICRRRRAGAARNIVAPNEGRELVLTVPPRAPDVPSAAANTVRQLPSRLRCRRE